MKPKNQYLVASVVVAIASFVDAAYAQEKIDVTTAGQAQAKLEAEKFLEKNKPDENHLILPDSFFSGKFKEQYTFDIPETRASRGRKGVTGSLSGDTGFPYHVANLVSKAMREAAEAKEKTEETWEDKKKVLLLTLSKHPFPGSASPVVEMFLKDWLAEVKRKVEDNALKFRLALKQAAYQYTGAVVGVQEAIKEKTKSTADVGTAVGGTGYVGVGGVGGYYHSDVIHERLMNGIYRRHHRRMNKITRIRARR